MVTEVKLHGTDVAKEIGGLGSVFSSSMSCDCTDGIQAGSVVTGWLS